MWAYSPPDSPRGRGTRHRDPRPLCCSGGAISAAARLPNPEGQKLKITTESEVTGVLTLGPVLREQAIEQGGELPCHKYDADLWFADAPTELEFAKSLCTDCPVKVECLAGAIDREEPWGVWGGEIFEGGAVVARKRPRGRPRKDAAQIEAAAQAELEARTAEVFATVEAV